MIFVVPGRRYRRKKKDELAEVKAELASLGTEFTQNVLHDELSWTMPVTLDDLAGCPESLIDAARGAASERDDSINGAEYVITLSRSITEPFLTFADNRELRFKAWKAWTERGEMSSERDNLKIAQQMLALRKRIAEIHGYKSFAAYQCDDRMAQTPEAVNELLENVWNRAKDVANEERRVMEEYVKSHGIDLPGGTIEPWDWRYYAEKVRQEKYDFDEGLLKVCYGLLFLFL